MAAARRAHGRGAARRGARRGRAGRGLRRARRRLRAAVAGRRRRRPRRGRGAAGGGAGRRRRVAWRRAPQARHPLPGRRRRPRGQGHELRRHPRRRRSVELAERYDAEGADELVFLDITATHEKRDTMVELARRTADNVFVPFTIGGGIRSVADAQAVLDAGADKISVNSAAVARPGAHRRARGPLRRAVRGPRHRRASAGGGLVGGLRGRRRTGDGARRGRLGARGHERGAGEILLTSMDRDGTNDGYDLALTSAVAERCRCRSSPRAAPARSTTSPTRCARAPTRRCAPRSSTTAGTGRRGQGAPGRRRHPGACVGTRRPRRPSAGSATTEGRPAGVAPVAREALRPPLAGTSQSMSSQHERNDVRSATRSATPHPVAPRRSGVNVGHAGHSPQSPRWSPPPSSRGSGRRARCWPRR